MPPLDYARRIALRQGQPPAKDAQAHATALVQKLTQPRPPAPLVPGGEPATPFERAQAIARQLIAEGKCSTMATALETVFATDPQLYEEHRHSFRASTETRAANLAAERSLAALNAQVDKVQKAHPDWSVGQVQTEVCKSHPDLYDAYVNARRRPK